MDIRGIGYLGFESPTAKAWLDYGTEVLGMQISDRETDDETVYLRMDDRRWRIAMHPGDVDRLAYVGWELTDRYALEDAVGKLESAGYDVTHGDAALIAQRGVIDVVQFTDPVGYRHELFYGLEFRPNSFVPGRPHYGFHAAESGIGHIVLVCPEYPPELDHLLSEVMGMRWFGYGHGAGRNTGFYATKLNPESHNIAYAAIPGHSGINHIGIPVKELDDVGIAYDKVVEKELTLVTTIGRHTQDPVVSFYSLTPSSFNIEYLWIDPARTFDDYQVEAQELSVWGHKMVGSMLPPSVTPVSA
jgi:2,3-dihydroxybiphenyl 1,2-dioxygenase